ncbi:hypothetical protein GCM10027405_14020 [Arthrobacter alkaliphilus]
MPTMAVSARTNSRFAIKSLRAMLQCRIADSLRRPPVTNMNATVIHVTRRLMIGITAKRRRDILQGPRRFLEYL